MKGFFRSFIKSNATDFAGEQPAAIEDVVAHAVGMVEYLSTHRVRGWAQKIDGRSADVEVHVNGVVIAAATANKTRPDIGDQLFDIELTNPIQQDAEVRVTVPGHGELPFFNNDRTINHELVRKDVRRRLRVPLYMSPFMEEIAAEEGWSAERLARAREFAETGLLKVKLTRPDMDQLRARIISELDELYRGGTRVQDAWRDSPGARELACDRQIQKILDELYGREAIPMQTLNFWRGTEQSTHADTVHFNSEPGNFMCGVWVALEPIGAHNGQLHYYPGSNKLPIIDMDDIGVVTHGSVWDQNYEYHQQVLHEIIRVKGLKKETLVAEPGEAIIWAANLWHGGEPIQQKGSTRHSQVTHYYFRGCSYYTPSLSNPPLGHFHRPDRRDIRTGEPLQHEFETIVLSHTPS
ncbi:phytanoyl-CoA dioxygenase family protein [Burkholderia cenocepacia]|uniref:phytanoyl-CoA dioxygenase family protein n=1 Tax=Burkholderia cenocepacia TaxID=95486 RepID=UPI001CF4E4F3|nr:phytanoyl-CoA dioxygenase family protein [Burkholderia cenocepacia]MCA8237774.1 phytanoyl-CoA dioxygenase family protein [Burkholderia cenocepacia]